MTAVAKSELDALARGEHQQPHGILGAHPSDDGVLVRAFRPGAQSVSVKPSKGKTVPLKLVHPAGIFEGEITGATLPLRYKLKVDYGDGGTFTLDRTSAPPRLRSRARRRSGRR